MDRIAPLPHFPQASDQATQERRSAEIIDFPRRERRPEGPVSPEGLQWYVDHPKEAAEDGIKPWQLEIIASRLHIQAQLDEEDRLNPEPVIPMSDADITRMLLEHPDEKWREAGRTGKWKRIPSDVTEREDSIGKPLPFHPAADIFPLLDERSPEFKSFTANIKEHGVLEPGRSLDGMLIIGRNRQNACIAAGVEMWVEPFPEGFNGDPVDLVISSNRHRVSWTSAQLAWITLNLAEVSHGGERPGSGRKPVQEQDDKSSGGFPHLKTDPENEVGWRMPVMTYAEAAARMSINIDQVNTAAAVKKLALPEIRAAIENGKIRTINHAYVVVTPNKDEKREGLTSEDKQRNWLNDPRNGIKPREPREKKPSIPFTSGALKALSDPAARVIVEKLMPKANRDLGLQGEQWIRVKLTDGEEPK